MNKNPVDYTEMNLEKKILAVKLWNYHAFKFKL